MSRARIRAVPDSSIDMLVGPLLLSPKRGPSSSVYIKPRTSPMLKTRLQFILLGAGILMQGKELHSKMT